MRHLARIMIYGAYGFTGELVTQAARRLRCELVVGGRDATRLRAIAGSLGITARAFALDDPSRIAEGIADIDILVNAAGPMVATAGPLIAACLDARTHYLDVTGEPSVFIEAHRHDSMARRRGIMIMPGAAFCIIASDCLAADVAALLPHAKYLRLGWSRPALISPGTLRATYNMVRDRVVIRRAGRLVAIPVGRLERDFDYGRGARTSAAVSSADVFTAYLTTGIPNIEGYVEATFAARTAGLLGVRVAAATRATPLRSFFDLALGSWGQRPSSQARKAAQQVLVAEVEDAWRRIRRVGMITSDGYSFTADAIAAVMERMIKGELAVGFQTPGKVYGPGLAYGIAGTRREDLDDIAQPGSPALGRLGRS
jgi:short subunit dehydrogenase-like uncharacterized protein